MQLILKKYLQDNKLTNLQRSSLQSALVKLQDPISINLLNYLSKYPYSYKNYELKQRSHNITRLLKIRKDMQLTQPSFKRYLSYIKRLDEAWRKPRGHQNKMRKNISGKGNRPRIGWRTPKAVRGFNSKGYPFIVVHNIEEFDNVNAQQYMVQIAHVGLKKRLQLENIAYEKNIAITNPIPWDVLLQWKN